MPEPRKLDPQHKRQITFSGFYLLVAVLAFWVLNGVVMKRIEPKAIPYSELLTLIRDGKVEQAELRANEIVAVMKPPEGRPQSDKPETVTATRLPGIDETALLKEMEDKKIKFSGRIDTVSWWETMLLSWIVPLALIMGIYYFAIRRLRKGVGPMSIGQNKAKIYDESQSDKVTFADVAGVDEAEAELVEVVDFLKHPEKYRALGARIPKGVLLVGPPGTGKTLLAKAVAGEAGVPFFSISGSAFVEMFVGVGAARMRDMFEQAKERAPCIVFIDELDAIGKSRGGIGAMAVHDEREQTLNQLLVEMDGFDGTHGVIIMAATNRPEVLDQALLRAGRFDRQVVVDRPDLKGREEILKVHAKRAKLGEGVDIRLVAQRTPGMVGADLANVVNEAALAAARRGSSLVELIDFEEAIDRIQLGLKKRGRAMSEEEKRRVAFHEGGHTLVALSVKHADPVHRVTIIPRSIGALGATLQLPTEERYLMTREELRDRICVMLGGRAAEELCCEDISTGAQNDLERATETARQMVCRFGMSEKLGPLTYGRPAGLRFLDAPAMFGEERNFSDETARAIDGEVRSLIDAEHARAKKVLTERREVLDTIAKRLLEVETLERAELEKMVGKPLPERRSGGIAKEIRPPAVLEAEIKAAEFDGIDDQ
ncbi:MAG: ATP-dependent metallopeptidase FtsH/Yme1/Tma family protein [Polyangiaceae bacterium]|nr:ATP-dependent metallopeptidase FtsH/Yme1/Tma family protein [Polyangiaceae bacterium]